MTVPTMIINRDMTRHYLYFVFIIFSASFMVIPSSKGINNIFYAGVIPLLILSITRSDLRTYHQSVLSNLWLAFLLFIPLNQFWTPEYDSSELFRNLKRVFYLYALGLTLFIILRDRRPLAQILIPTIAILVMLNGIFGGLIRYHDGGFPYTRLYGFGRMENPISLGIIAVTYSIIAFFMSLEKRAALRALWGSVLLINVLIMLLAQSRSAILALMGTLFILLLHGRARVTALLIATLVIVIGIAFTVFDAGLLLNRGLSYRPDIWAYELSRAWSCGIFLGCGQSIPRDLSLDGYHILHAHSLYIGTLLYGGLAGLTLLFSILFLAFRAGSGNPHARPWRALLAGGCMAMLVDGHTLLFSPNPFWLYLHIPLCALIALTALGPATEPLRTGPESTQSERHQK